jgi:hypothetical protein
MNNETRCPVYFLEVAAFELEKMLLHIFRAESEALAERRGRRLGSARAASVTRRVAQQSLRTIAKAEVSLCLSASESSRGARAMAGSSYRQNEYGCRKDAACSNNDKAIADIKELKGASLINRDRYNAVLDYLDEHRFYLRKNIAIRSFQWSNLSRQLSVSRIGQNSGS